MIPSGPSADYLNYYTTGTPDKGITGIKHFSKVTFKDVYPGIDLEFITSPEQACKYNFVIRPGGDVSRIKIKIAGPGSIALVGEKLVLTTSMGDAEEVIPESYSLNGDSRTTVKAHFREIDKKVYGFTVEGDVPRSSTLVIDPTTLRQWATYYGGFDWDAQAQCSVDKNGNVFMGGSTMSLNNIATSGLYQPVLAGIIDGFLVKFNATGQRQWGTYFGGELEDMAMDCTTDSTGNVYIAGTTGSPDNIASFGAHQTTFGGWDDCFLAKFNTDGQRLWSTYYGGTGSDLGYGC